MVGKTFCKLLVVVLLAGLASCSGDDDNDPSSFNNKKSIVILYENDVHCNIDGYTKFVGLRDAIALTDTSYVGMVSSGDYLQGALAGAISRGQFIVDIMKNVGYDAITLGNHEFDYLTPHMLELLPQIGAPIVCTNLFEYGSSTPMFPGYVIKRYGDKKIAFVGTLTPETKQSESYAFFDTDKRQLYDLPEAETYTLVQKAADQARKEGADYVVVLSHLGEKNAVTGIDSHRLVETTNGIDAVLDGHTHAVIPCEWVTNKDGKKIPVTQTGTQFDNVGKLWISQDGTFHTMLVPSADIPYTNPRITATTDSIKRLLGNATNRQLATSDFDLPAKDAAGAWIVRREEAPLGDLVADAFRIQMGADIGIINGGGVRNGINAGVVNYGHVVSVLPNDNCADVIEATGSEILNMLSKCTESCPGADGSFPQVSGMKYTIHTLTHTVTDVEVYDKASNSYKPIVAEQTYTIAINDYYQSGGYYDTLANCTVREKSPNLIRDILAEYLEKTLNGIIPETYRTPQGRITIMTD